MVCRRVSTYHWYSGNRSGFSQKAKVKRTSDISASSQDNEIDPGTKMKPKTVSGVEPGDTKRLTANKNLKIEHQH